MENTLLLLMTETSPEICRLCQKSLPEYNIQVNVCARNGVTAYQEVVKQ